MFINKQCDVCLNVYGKIFQTLVTLKTLLKYNSQFINKIFILFEKEQPESFDIDLFKNYLEYENIEMFTPKYYFHYNDYYLSKLWKIKSKKNIVKVKGKKNEDYRNSIRYQYALERSKSRYMLIIHNDVLFYNAFVNEMIDYIDAGFLGAGSIGQCWNCPLYFEKICNGDLAPTLQLDYGRICEVIQRNPSPRTKIEQIDHKQPLPMPECRLNEWVAMLNVAEYQKIVIPNGPLTPIGYFGLDIGVDFYREAILNGYKFKNIDLSVFSTHAFFAEKGCGNAALFDKAQYIREEEAARDYLFENLLKRSQF